MAYYSDTPPSQPGSSSASSGAAGDPRQTDTGTGTASPAGPNEYGSDPAQAREDGTPTTAPAPTDVIRESPAPSSSPSAGTPAAPPAAGGLRGSWVDLRTGGDDDNPQTESALVVSEHSDAGDVGWAHLYVFPKGGAAYPFVAQEGDEQDQYRR